MLTQVGLVQIVFYLVVLLALVVPIGRYMTAVYDGRAPILGHIGRPLEQLLYRFCGIHSEQRMNWKEYLSTMLVFNGFSVLLVYGIQRLQIFLPLNPQHFPAIPAGLAMNTAISYVTNTNWQAYSGETSMSYFTQMVAFTTQNFLSAATGMSLLVALTRGIARCESQDLGNYWVDMVRGVLYILLPLSLIFACLLVSQGVIQNLKPNQHVKLIDPIHQSPVSANATSQTMTDGNGHLKEMNQWILEQVIPMGPVASQVAIKQLGSNGGGFFNANAAHPFENPTLITNFLEMLAILLIPASFCYAFGVMVRDQRQGWAILVAMLVILIPMMVLDVMIEQAGNPTLNSMDIDQKAKDGYALGGNMEGKEVRFGIVGSAMWAVATTASSNGSVNSMLDSYLPAGGMIPMWLMQTGEVIIGGIGSGVYGMLMLIIITVFIAGLMVGRTPEYLGKKIEPFEMKMASIAVLLMPFMVLLATAIAAVTNGGISSVGQSGIHGFSEMLYAFTSTANNNGSAFSGLNANTPFYHLVTSILMLIGRYWTAIPVLALAGSFAAKKRMLHSSGTLGTHTILFILLLVGITIILGALSFLPALALGPIVEQLNLTRG